MTGVALLVRFPVRRETPLAMRTPSRPKEPSEGRIARATRTTRQTTPFPSRPQSPSDGFLASSLSLERVPPSSTTVPGSSVDSCIWCCCCCCCRPLDNQVSVPDCLILTGRRPRLPRPSPLSPPSSPTSLFPHGVMDSHGSLATNSYGLSPGIGCFGPLPPWAACYSLSVTSVFCSAPAPGRLYPLIPPRRLAYYSAAPASDSQSKYSSPALAHPPSANLLSLSSSPPLKTSNQPLHLRNSSASWEVYKLCLSLCQSSIHDPLPLRRSLIWSVTIVR